MVEIDLDELESKGYLLPQKLADRVIRYEAPPEIPAALVASARWPEGVLTDWFEKLPYDEGMCEIRPAMPTRRDVGRNLGYSDEELLSELKVDEYYKQLISDLSDRKLRKLNIEVWCDAVKRVPEYIKDVRATPEEICVACMGEFLRNDRYRESSFEKYLELCCYAIGKSPEDILRKLESKEREAQRGDKEYYRNRDRDWWRRHTRLSCVFTIREKHHRKGMGCATCRKNI